MKIEIIDNLILQRDKLEKELKTINDNIEYEKQQIDMDIKDKFGISKHDLDLKCRKHCDNCIIPCKKCREGNCTQCRYGWKTILEKITEKYYEEQIESMKDECIYCWYISEYNEYLK